MVYIYVYISTHAYHFGASWKAIRDYDRGGISSTRDFIIIIIAVVDNVCDRISHKVTVGCRRCHHRDVMFCYPYFLFYILWWMPFFFCVFCFSSFFSSFVVVVVVSFSFFPVVCVCTAFKLLYHII